MVRDGDFTALCDREFTIIVGALTLWCGDRAVAEEATSEAFARAYRDWRRVRHLDAPGAWVRRVAMNLVTSTFRRRTVERRARRRLHQEAQRGAQDPCSAEAVTVREALQRLGEDHRTVLVLRYYLDLPISEVADVMGRSTSATTSLTNRAAAALRAELDPDPNTGASREVHRER